MQVEEFAARHADAAERFEAHEQRVDGRDIAHGLTHGLNLLRTQFARRIHDDVEKAYGADSMVGPVSVLKVDSRINAEIEVYLVAEASIVAQRYAYVRDHQWFAEWLGRLRLGSTFDQHGVQERLAGYLQQDDNARELAFTNQLVRTLREANRAPLVLYRLFPLAIGVVTAVAFGDLTRAAELRGAQVRLLPAIEDCRECFGGVLENGDRCTGCGNPVWKYAWLQSTD